MTSCATSTTLLLCALLCGAQTLAAAGEGRKLLQASAFSFGQAFTNGQTSIYDALTHVTDDATGRSFATAAANAFGQDQNFGLTCETDYAREFGAAMVRASNTNLDSAATAIEMAQSEGGHASDAMAVAIAIAFAKNDQGFVTAFSVAIATVGCSAMRPMLAKAQSMATAAGNGGAFNTGVARATAVAECLNGNATKATADAKAATSAVGGSTPSGTSSAGK